MIKRSVLISLGFVLIIFLVSFACAKVSIDSEPNEVYNLGDKLYLTVTTVPASEYGNLNIDLVCENNSVNLLRWPSAEFGEQYNYALPPRLLTEENLEVDDISDMTGNCQVIASLGVEEDSTETFLITDEIKINAKSDKSRYDPGERITLEVEAIKANGESLDGFLEVSGAIEFKKAIKNGFASESFIMPDITEAREYRLDIFVYDQWQEKEILNKGNASLEFKINQIASSIETSLFEIETEPGTDFGFAMDLYDQSGKHMDGVISVLFISPSNEEIPLTINSGDSGSINLLSNATAGIWKIRSNFENIFDVKEFKIKPVAKVKFDFLDSVLIIKNIGNTVYNKTVKLTIGGEINELKLDIGIGKEKRFNIKAPDGEYNVLVSDGSSSTEKLLLLTGRVISVDDLTKLGFLNKYPIIWVFLIILLGLIAVALFFRFRKKTFKLRERMKNFSFSKKEDKFYHKDALDISQPKVSEAESSLVLKGEKNQSAIVSLKIYNHSELKGHAKEELEKILEKARQEKAMIELKDGYILMVFSPLITKTFNNEFLAVKTGFEIFEKLNDYNKKFSDRIKFNIGINSGDLIASVENKKLKYTTVGNTVLLAKRISDFDINKILVSNNVRKKMIRDLKVEEAGTIGKTKIYSVSKMKDKQANQEKLAEILRRMNKI